MKFYQSKNIYSFIFYLNLSSLDMFKNEENMKNIKKSEGKSGSFFFFTHDQKFIIKTINTSEKEVLLSEFLKSYYEHIKEGSSLITRIYGVYEVIIQ